MGMAWSAGQSGNMACTAELLMATPMLRLVEHWWGASAMWTHEAFVTRLQRVPQQRRSARRRVNVNTVQGGSEECSESSESIRTAG